MKKYLEILSLEDSHCVYRIDITGKSDSQIDRICDGLQDRMNLNNYYLDNLITAKMLKTGNLIGE